MVEFDSKILKNFACPTAYDDRLFMEETIEHVVRSITPARERKAWKNLAQYLRPPLNTAQ